MSDLRPTAVIVLAAGEGTRMKSATPKVLHTIGGRTLVGHAIRAARGIEPAAPRRRRAPRARPRRRARHRGRPRGRSSPTRTTSRAPAAPSSAPSRRSRATSTGTVVVTYGDVPLLDGETLRGLVAAHHASGSAVTVITGNARRTRPATAGSLRDAEGCRRWRSSSRRTPTSSSARSARSTAGSYAFDAAVLRDALAEVGTDNAQGEKYLTDVIAIARGRRSGCARPPRRRPVADRGRQRPGAAGAARAPSSTAAPSTQAMREGVTVIDPATTWIDADVTIGPDTDRAARHAAPRRDAPSASDAVIGPDTTLTDVEVGDGASVVRTQAELAVIGAGATVGPVLLPAPRHPARREGQDRRLRRDQERRRSATAPRCPHLSYVRRRRRSARAPTSAPARSSPTTTASRSTTRPSGAHSFVGSNSVIVAPVHHRRRRLRRGAARRSPATSARASSPWRAASSATSTAGSPARRAGTKTADAARARRQAARHAERRPTQGQSTTGEPRPVSAADRVSGIASDHREEPHGLLRPGAPRARRGGRRRSSAPSSCRRQRLRLRQRRDLRALRGVGARLATPSSSRATPLRSTSGSWSS